MEIMKQMPFELPEDHFQNEPQHPGATQGFRILLLPSRKGGA